MKKVLLAEHKRNKVFHLPDSDTSYKYLVQYHDEDEGMVEQMYYSSKYAFCHVYDVTKIDKLPINALIILIDHLYHIIRYGDN